MSDLILQVERVTLTESRTGLRAYVTVRLGDYSIDGIKVVQNSTRFLVCMPDKKAADTCPVCGARNNITANYCEKCGQRRAPGRAVFGSRGEPIYHFEVFHPIGGKARADLEKVVLRAYHAVAKSR